MSLDIWFNYRCRVSRRHWLVGEGGGKEADATAHVGVIAEDVKFGEASDEQKKQGCWMVAHAASATCLAEKPEVPKDAIKILLAGERFVDPLGHTIDGCDRLILTSDDAGRAVAYAVVA